MPRHGSLALAVALAASTFLLAGCRSQTMKPGVLRVGFPLVLLKADRSLLNPQDTDSVYQFYLLENLAIGLVRDDSRSPSGYVGGLVESWEQAGPSRWAFYLKKDLRWSDGTPIRPEDVAAHLRTLGGGRYRHIIYMKELEHVAVEGDKLLLDFRTPVNDGLIHELSLADAALVHPRAAQDGWRVVSGPYSVASYDPGKNLVLKRNPYFVMDRNAPDSVELVPFTMDSIAEFFAKTPVDFLKVPAPAFRQANRAVLSHAPEVLRGYPTWIYYLYFNQGRGPWRNAGARRAFASVVRDALAEVSFPGLARERQFIPEGFAGRLAADPRIPAAEAAPLPRGKLKIRVIPSFSEAVPILDALKRAFAGKGIEVEYVFSWKSAESEGADVGLSQFAGNQRDSLGSWEFLFSPGRGDLAPFRGEVEPLFTRVLTAKDKAAREEVLRELHREAISRAYVVPLYIEPDMIAAGDRVDLSGINRFDMRLRFYEVLWK